MNWALAIERNRAALVAVASAIAALVNAQHGGGMLARSLRNAALALLRPAEAAARRLIVVAGPEASRRRSVLRGPSRPKPSPRWRKSRRPRAPPAAGRPPSSSSIGTSASGLC